MRPDVRRIGAALYSSWACRRGVGERVTGMKKCIFKKLRMRGLNGCFANAKCNIRRCCSSYYNEHFWMLFDLYIILFYIITTRCCRGGRHAIHTVVHASMPPTSYTAFSPLPSPLFPPILRDPFPEAALRPGGLAGSEGRLLAPLRYRRRRGGACGAGHLSRARLARPRAVLRAGGSGSCACGAGGAVS